MTETNYHVCWRCRATGREGNGEAMSAELADAWVKYGNEKYPGIHGIHHFRLSQEQLQSRRLVQNLEGRSKLRSIDGTYCRECGGHMIKLDGTWHHGERGEIWTEDDQDHQPVEDKGFEE